MQFFIPHCLTHNSVDLDSMSVKVKFFKFELVCRLLNPMTIHLSDYTFDRIASKRLNFESNRIDRVSRNGKLMFDARKKLIEKFEPIELK